MMSSISPRNAADKIPLSRLQLSKHHCSHFIIKIKYYNVQYENWNIRNSALWELRLYITFLCAVFKCYAQLPSFSPFPFPSTFFPFLFPSCPARPTLPRVARGKTGNGYYMKPKETQRPGNVTVLRLKEEKQKTIEGESKRWRVYEGWLSWVVQHIRESILSSNWGFIL